MIVSQDQVRPWLLTVWELLPTKAPNPSIAQPYCCYAKTVIFYLRPYVVRPWHRLWVCNGKRLAQKPGGGYEAWDQVETRYTWDDIVEHNGERFAIGGGLVVWHKKRWWMKHNARRVQEASR